MPVKRIRWTIARHCSFPARPINDLSLLSRRHKAFDEDSVYDVVPRSSYRLLTLLFGYPASGRTHKPETHVRKTLKTLRRFMGQSVRYLVWLDTSGVLQAQNGMRYGLNCPYVSNFKPYSTQCSRRHQQSSCSEEPKVADIVGSIMVSKALFGYRIW